MSMCSKLQGKHLALVPGVRAARAPHESASEGLDRFIFQSELSLSTPGAACKVYISEGRRADVIRQLSVRADGASVRGGGMTLP